MSYYSLMCAFFKGKKKGLTEPQHNYQNQEINSEMILDLLRLSPVSVQSFCITENPKLWLQSAVMSHWYPLIRAVPLCQG